MYLTITLKASGQSNQRLIHISLILYDVLQLEMGNQILKKLNCDFVVAKYILEIQYTKLSFLANHIELLLV